MTSPRRSAMSWLTGDVPSATTAPRAGRRASVVMLVLLGLAAAGCTREPAAPPSHRLEGTYIVHGVFSHQKFGSPCRSADAGYPDILPGTAVRVRDATKAVVGTAQLQGGTLRNGPLRGNDDDCVFSFSLTVPERDAYRIEVGKRPGQVLFTRSDLEKSSWKADLTIGAYTMFGGI
ncbi:MAG TPA: hypothetical protein VG673_03095 [Actinomycetota bacterium]|nr:hypothetical protein [Actinomycetota bacterium]